MNDKLDEDDRCPSTNKRHEPAMESASLQWDGDTLYVDVNCTHCGRSGCLGKFDTLTKEISW